jgi:hypothetical protein
VSWPVASTAATASNSAAPTSGRASRMGSLTLLAPPSTYLLKQIRARDNP